MPYRRRRYKIPTHQKTEMELHREEMRLKHLFAGWKPEPLTEKELAEKRQKKGEKYKKGSN